MGVRTAPTGVRPTVEGVRTATEGGSPGTGVRTAPTGVRIRLIAFERRFKLHNSSQGPLLTKMLPLRARALELGQMFTSQSGI